MKVLKTTFALGLVAASNQVKASDFDINQANIDFYTESDSLSAITGLNLIDKCGYLLDLSNEPFLSAYEQKVEATIFNMMSKLTTDPINYCDDYAMAEVIETEPDVELR